MNAPDMNGLITDMHKLVKKVRCEIISKKSEINFPVKMTSDL